MTDDKQRPPVLSTEAPTERLPPAQPAIDLIPGFHLLQKLGEGGMGEVWEAEQLEPVRRKVALKLIKRGMESREVLARFESERQALALMSHPNIAQVHYAGVSRDGRPYFVMEHVQGVPITQYCDVNRLDTNERLDLFVQVCDGVQHAHHKGVIHRDLKPSNVLVTIQNGRPVPKIIDFGVAKATAQRLTERTVFTELGQLIGTPEYMSPEQAEMTGLDIDTRTDVYSLGVVLYELLVGALPFDTKELRQAGFDEIRRKIREDDPSRPSTRVTNAGDDSAIAAKNRRTEPVALARELRGDLDWITMKTLEKDRTRRYGTPAELAADIGRHRWHEPVLAGPPSTVYKLQKFIRRHTVGVAATAVVLLVLVLGILGTTFGMIRARRAERLASQEAETARQVSDFLISLFEVSDPTLAKGETITARQILDEGAERIRRDLDGEPVIQARMMETMGEVYMNLGLHEKSHSLLDRALSTRERLLGPRHPETIDSMCDLGVVLQRNGDYEEARRVLERGLALGEEVLGPEDPIVASALEGLGRVALAVGDYAEAENYYERSLESYEASLGPDDPKVARVLGTLGVTFRLMGEHGPARQSLERAVQIKESALGPDHPDVAVSLHALANVLRETGDREEARRLGERALTIDEKVFGPEHPRILGDVNLLGILHATGGELEESLRLFERGLAIAEKAYGPDDHRVGQLLMNLGVQNLDMGNYEEARSLLERSLEIHEEHLGSDHPNVARNLDNLASAAHAMGDTEGAVPLRERALAIREKALGPDHPEVGNNVMRLASDLIALSDTERARSLLERALAIAKKAFGPQHSDVAWVLLATGNLMAETGEVEEARSTYERALEVAEKALGPEDHPVVAYTLSSLGELQHEVGDYEGAEASFVRALGILEKRLGPDHPDVADSLEGYAALLRTLERNDQAGQLEARAASIRHGKTPAEEAH